MRYASVFITILIVWLAIIILAALNRDTTEIKELYLLTMCFTLGMFLFGFARRKG